MYTGSLHPDKLYLTYFKACTQMHLLLSYLMSLSVFFVLLLVTWHVHYFGLMA